MVNAKLNAPMKGYEFAVIGLAGGLILGFGAMALNKEDNRTAIGVFGSVAATLAIGCIGFKQVDPIGRRQTKIMRLEHDLASAKQSEFAAVNYSEQLKEQLTRLETSNQDLSQTREMLARNDERATHTLSDLTKQLSVLQGNLETVQREKAEVIQAHSEYLEDIAEKIECEIELRTKERVQKIRETEIDKIFDDSATLAARQQAIAEKFADWGRRAHARNSELRSTFENAVEYQNGEVMKFIAAKDAQTEELMNQIEILRMAVADANQKADGVFTEPQYLEAGYDLGKKAANDMASYIHRTLNISLRVFAVQESEGLYTIGYQVSRNANRFEIAATIEQIAPTMSRVLGINKITSVEPNIVSEGIVLTFRLIPAPPKSDEEILREYVKPASEFGALIRKYHNFESDGKPTLRIMSATGGGKAIAAKNIIQSYVKSERGFEIWLSDPMDGSDEDKWHIPKVATDKESSRKSFKSFVTEFDARAAKKSSHSRVKLLGVFDEFDKNSTDADKKEAQRIWTAIRHHRMRMILIGQSGEVGRNGWQWDEMKNCTLLYIGDGIDTAIKHAKDLGLTQTKAKELQTKYDAISDWMTEKNKSLSSAKKYRLALLISGKVTQFVFLPVAIEGGIEFDKSTIVWKPWESESQEKADSNTADIAPLATIKQPNPDCPVCEKKMQSNGSNWLCKNPEHTSEMGKKKYPKSEF